MLRRRMLLIPMTATLLVPTAAAQATHSLALSTNTKATLLSPRRVQVEGTLTCVEAAEDGRIGVVLIQPPGGIALTGGGAISFSCSAGETVIWSAVVLANESSTFTKGRARFDTFAHADCSDEEVDCPSVGKEGILKIKKVKSKSAV